jgi:endonuclease YncB( thermonuclease family)
MVRQGMAVSFGAYHAEEAQAREARAGVWAGSFERPKDYRRDERAGQSGGGDPLSSIGDVFRWLAGSS